MRRKHLFIVLSSLNAFKSSFKRGVVFNRAVAMLQSVENQPLARGIKNSWIYLNSPTSVTEIEIAQKIKFFESVCRTYKCN